MKQLETSKDHQIGDISIISQVLSNMRFGGRGGVGATCSRLNTPLQTFKLFIVFFYFVKKTNIQINIKGKYKKENPMQKVKKQNTIYWFVENYQRSTRHKTML